MVASRLKPLTAPMVPQALLPLTLAQPQVPAAAPLLLPVSTSEASSNETCRLLPVFWLPTEELLALADAHTSMCPA
jgi:hypothetical protein